MEKMDLGGDGRGDAFDQNPMYKCLQDLIVSVKTVKTKGQIVSVVFPSPTQGATNAQIYLMFDAHEIKHVRKHFYQQTKLQSQILWHLLRELKITFSS